MMLFLGSCIAKNVTNDHERWRYLSREYELTVPAFVTEWKPERSFDLQMEGGGEVPVSVEDYWAHPHDWMHSEAFKQKHGPCAQSPGWAIAHVRGVVSAGTRIRITKLVEKDNRLIGKYIVVYGRVLDVRYSDLEVCVDQMMGKMGSRSPPCPKPDFRYLKEV